VALHMQKRPQLVEALRRQRKERTFAQSVCVCVCVCVCHIAARLAWILCSWLTRLRPSFLLPGNAEPADWQACGNAG
jgi:hypothetical protein